MSNIKSEALVYTAQKMKFSVKAFFGKFDQIHRFLRIWSHLLKKSLMENFIFCSVLGVLSKKVLLLQNSLERTVCTSLFHNKGTG